MSKKNKKKDPETTIENYYDLRVDKVDDLVEALKTGQSSSDEDISFNIADCTGINDSESTTKSGKQKQFDPYKIDKLSRIPTWIKAIFIKFWFAGAVCYFIIWGLSNYITDALDLIVFCGLVMGVVVDVLVNPLFRFMESDRKEYNPYMLFPFPFKAFWTFFTNIIYYILVLAIVNLAYTGINELINLIAGTENLINVGIEPLLFGVLVTIVDMFFIGIKDLVVFIVKRIKNRKNNFEVEANV
jgi:hypothetical protein